MTINHLKLKLSCSLHPEVADYLAVNDDEWDQPDSLAGAGALHLREQLLLHGVQEVGAEVARMEQDLMLQGDLREHREQEDTTGYATGEMI